MDLPIHTDEETLVILGVDTHADAHVAVALDGFGKRLGSKSVPATEAGYAALVAWAEEFGELDRAGVEGSGSFGVGLVRFVRARGAEVVEVKRPQPPAQAQIRQARHRRRRGRREGAPGEHRHRRAQERRRSCGDGARPARGAAFGGQGAHTGCQPTARLARHRARRA